MNYIFSPITEVKHANISNRTNLKLQLMRQQAEDDQKREQQQYSQSLKNTYTSSVIDMPPAPVQKSEVPPQILQVSILEPPYKVLHYRTVLDIRQFKVDPRSVVSKQK